MNVIKSLQWRYAVKQFSTDVINDGQVQALLTATRLSASSFGLQPYRLLIVKSTEIRQQLLAYSMGQDKVLNSSHLIVFATQTNLGDEIVHAYIDQVSKVRGIPSEELQDLTDQIKGSLAAKTPQQKNAWAKNQTYLALGNFLTCAAIMGIDACPMEGFNAEGYDNVLGLADKALTTAVICPIGTRHEDDPFARMPKIRFDAEKMVLTF
ncbi:MAG: nitroreductase family protein [Gammaproteobacteria bacterium]|nr:nitroreductase family protein [Gammaproteobacteria bacterium]